MTDAERMDALEERVKLAMAKAAANKARIRALTIDLDLMEAEVDSLDAEIREVATMIAVDADLAGIAS